MINQQTPAAMMLAARAYAGEDRFRLEQVPVPEIGPDDALIAVRSTGITRGLLSLWGKGRIKLLPATLGHEIAGVVAGVGQEVRGVAVGDRVRVHAPLTPRNDLFLQRDDEPASPDVCVIGHAIYGDGAMPLYERYHNGGLAEFVKVPWWSLDRLDDAVSFDVGARIHSLAIAWRALRKAGPDHGSVMVVNGATGATGGAAVLCAPLWGAVKIIAVSRTRAALEPVRALAPGMVEPVGIDELGPDWEERGALTKRIVELSGGVGADCILDYLPGSPAQTLQGVFALRRGGRAVLGGGNWSELSFPYGRLVSSNWEIKGANGLTRRDGHEVHRLVAAQRLDPSPLFSHRFPLESVNDAVEVIHSRHERPQFVTITPSSAA